MYWTQVLIGVVAALVAIVVGLALAIQRRGREQHWETAAANHFDCPLASGKEVVLTPVGLQRGETQWDRTLREVGDPADILTTGPEFAMPEAK